MLSALAEAGHKIDLVAPCHDIPHANIRLLPESAKKISKAKLLLLATNAHFRKSYDAIHAADSAVFYAMYLCRWRKCRLVYDASRRFSGASGSGHSRLWKWFPRRFQRLEKKVLERADLVFSSCGTLTSNLAHLERSATPVQIEDVPLQSLYTLADQTEPSVLQAFECRPGALVMCSCLPECHGGCHKILLAARKVIEQVPDVGFIFRGCMNKKAADMAERLDISGNCLFVKDRSVETFLSLLSFADATLLIPSDKQRYLHPDVYTLLKSGVPIVSIQNGAYMDILDDKTAIQTLSNAEAIAEGLLRAILEPLFSRALATEGQKRIANQFTLSSFKYRVRGAYLKMGARRN
ncbi:MAG: hypothetical protein K9M45_10120 [Kiritimatiellales bacterium]|nr:hypothetical protein [Kiritimatiellales bacterium]